MDRMYIIGNAKTSAQIAIQDPVFKELFGRIWCDGGYLVRTPEDFSYALLYKDIILQAVSDWANQSFVRYNAKERALAIDTIPKWLHHSSPFNNPEVKTELLVGIQARKQSLYHKAKKGSKRATSRLRTLERFAARMEQSDPFEFNTCCEVTGINTENARLRFDYLRGIKANFGANVRIIKKTGGRIDSPIPELEAGSELAMHEYLHPGFNRSIRDSKIQRLNIKVTE